MTLVAAVFFFIGVLACQTSGGIVLPSSHVQQYPQSALLSHVPQLAPHYYQQHLYLQPQQQPLVQHTAPASPPQITAEEKYTIVDSEAGKANVKLLYVAKEGPVHSIKELEVRTALALATTKEYRFGDNSDVIATDSQKNTINIFAKQYGVKSPELFAARLAQHFLLQYPQVVRAEVQVHEKPWSRIQDAQGRAHNHAFVSIPSSTRYAAATQDRTGAMSVSAGIRGLTVIKTTNSGFVNFVDDEYRTLADQPDRVLSTTITADWTYADVQNLDFDLAWRSIRDIILEQFAGPVDTGVYSASVQNTQHNMQRAVLDAFPQVESITIDMPNRHYFGIDFSVFPIEEVQGQGAGEVLLPVDKPAGFITSTLTRSETA